jgi:ribosomal protein S18 acetylase RimI-like enzyme
MTVRAATAADLPELERLWRASAAEVEPPVHEEVDAEVELQGIREIVDSGLGWVAERDGTAVGMVLVRRSSPHAVRLTDLYVTPEARRERVAERLVREVVAHVAADGVEHLHLDVHASNTQARDVYRRWGLREEVLTLVAPLDALAERLGGPPSAPSFGSIHVQTDDVGAIAKSVEMLVPRLPGRSAGSIVTQPVGGYVTVYDDVCDRDPAMLRRLAKEISTRTGLVVIVLGLEHEAVVRMILIDRGGIVDEYASVPEFYAPLPPGEVVALQANPVVVERYTGANRAAVRAAAPVAASPSELPPPFELLAGLAAVLGLEGAAHGWAGAPELEGAIHLLR